jgi:hypothetical protein
VWILLVVSAVVAIALSVLVGLNVVFTVALLLLFAVVVLLVHRWRQGRSADATSGVLGYLGTGALSAVAVFALIQVVPYGRAHSNGSIVAEPKWPDAQTRALVVRACFDCHSNEVKYPWYSNVAPISWLVAEHVSDGREAVNFSNFRAGGEGSDNVIEAIREGSMPPSYFTRFGLHHQAKLTKAEMDKLVASLSAMPEFKHNGG